VNLTRLRRTPNFHPVIKKDMTTVNPNAGLQPKTSVLQYEPPKSGKSSSLQVT
jgi:hypothetical protein